MPALHLAAGENMADETLQESFSGSTKALLGAIGFLLLMFGGEIMIEKQEPRLALGAVLVACGILCFYLAWAGRALRRRLPAGSIARFNTIGADPRWWLISLLILISAIVMWRFAEAAFPAVDIRQLQETETRNTSLIEQLQTAKHDLEKAVQELAQARSRSASPQDCTVLLRLRSELSQVEVKKHEWNVFPDEVSDDDIRSVMKRFGCLSD
jgi:hypothetical protein